jgi:hypothetical protein
VTNKEIKAFHTNDISKQLNHQVVSTGLINLDDKNELIRKAR